MATKTFKVALSLDNPRIIQSGITVQSFDKQSVKISIALTKDSQTYQIPIGATIRISLLKLSNQAQKIIVDVPNDNRESIDWIVPDYLDGYHGVVRCGVYLLHGTESVDLGYFTILSNVSDIDKMAEEFTDNVFGGWEAIEEELRELNITIAQTKLDLAEDTTQVDNTIANINAKNTQVNTLASDFADNVAIKQSDVTSKYDAFDTSVTAANQTITDILALKEMNLYYDSQLGEYINLNWFYQSQKTGKVYTSEFYKYTVSPSSTGVKKDANAGLVAEPSANAFAGRDDYMDIALFKPLDVNGYVDDNDNYHVTAIKGDGRFRSDGTNGDVWVMNMTGFMKRFETETTWGYSYSDVMHPGYTVVPGGKKLDGTIRPFILRAKYPAVRNPHDDNKLASISGQNPEYINMSHNGQITEFKKKGAQYSGKTTHDDFWVKLMLMLKYASTNSDTVGNGCNNYYTQYAPAVLETGKSRFVVANAQAAALVVGSRVSIGDLGATVTVDRDSALLHNVRNRVMISGIEPLADGVNSVVNLDTTPFDVTSTMRISTVPWGSGACDNVKGVDGSPINGKSNKEPLLINGIEMLHGGYEVLQNVMIYNDNANPDNYEIKVFICYDCTKYATTATVDYKLLSKRLVQTNNTWSYLATCEVDPQHPSLMVQSVAGASSSTGFGDGVYTNSPVTGYREWLSLGHLGVGLLGGFWCLYGGSSLTGSGWGVLGRLSATGRSRGEEA
jgi:hypothetical protein